MDGPMNETDISVLLCSRICHDLISPVGAIYNGVELLEEMRAAGGEELQLIGQSAATASATLQFYRLAFGGAGAGEAYPLSRCRQIALDKYRREKVEIDWPEDMGDLTRATARLICNMLMIATGALPRGGRVAVRLGFDQRLSVRMKATGPVVRLTEEGAKWLSGEDPGVKPEPRDVHFVTARRHADACGAQLAHQLDEAGLALVAVAPALA